MMLDTLNFAHLAAIEEIHDAFHDPLDFEDELDELKLDIDECSLLLGQPEILSVDVCHLTPIDDCGSTPSFATSDEDCVSPAPARQPRRAATTRTKRAAAKHVPRKVRAPRQRTPQQRQRENKKKHEKQTMLLDMRYDCIAFEEQLRESVGIVLRQFDQTFECGGCLDLLKLQLPAELVHIMDRSDASKQAYEKLTNQAMLRERLNRIPSWAELLRENDPLLSFLL